MSNKFFCPLPWNHLLFKQKGTVQACCETWDTQFKPAESILATANLDIMKQLRLDLLDDDTVPSMCHKCYNREKFQDFSVRINSMRIHPHWTPESAQAVTSADGSVDNFHLEHLDIRWSNLCNYKCRFCGIQSSNMWLKDAQLLGIEPNLVKNNYNPKTGIAEYDMDWEDLKTHLPYVKYVKLAGGEPTIMTGTYQLLEEMDRIGNRDVMISLITNGTTVQYGKHDLLELLGRFKDVRIQISLEAFGARHEWSRSGKKDWDIIEKNMEKFQLYGNANNWKINIHSGISWINMYHLADFVKKYDTMDFVFNMVTTPKEMSMVNFYKSDLQTCSDHYAKLLKEKNNSRVNKHLFQIKKVIDHGLKNTKEDIDLDEFRRVHGILDESRQQSFAESYPEWRKYA
jgi:MoaA/NifB/PqqE/SkfB family radical SAM enzyme